MVRLEHLGARGVVRRVRARLRDRAVAGARSRRWSAPSSSFLLVGLVSIAGKRGSAPTLVLSRAPFGRCGNTPARRSSPTCLLVGWETVLVALSTLATATVFERLGWSHGDGTKVVAFVVVAAVIVLRRDHRLRPDHAAAEVPHARADRRHRRLRRPHLGPHPPLDAARAIPNGDTSAVIGAGVLVMTGFGLGWVNTAADYSRYLPRNASTAWRRLVADVRREPAGRRPGGVRRTPGRVVADAQRRRSAATRSAP